MNAINIINPYRWNNMWVFDDSSKELDKEPLVEGADTLLSMLTNQENAIITFSENKFPSAEIVVEMTEDFSHVNGGTYYHCAQYDHKLWLCPALLKYFTKPPQQIHFSIKS